MVTVIFPNEELTCVEAVQTSALCMLLWAGEDRGRQVPIVTNNYYKFPLMSPLCLYIKMKTES